MERRVRPGSAWRIFLCAVCVFCMTVGCGGCRIGDRDIVVSGSIGSSKLFWIGNKSCSSREAMVYLANYQNIYGTSCGVDLWQHDFGDDSLEQYVKDITIGELAQVICMDQLAENINTGQSAEEQGISLDDNELEQINLAAKEYFSSLSEAEIAYMDGVSENDINEYYQHYALAQKLYHSLTAGVNGEVSDDEARVIEIMQIFVSGKEAAEEVEEKLAAGEDFASLANNYNELSAIQITVARDDLPEAVEQVAFELDNDAVSDVIPVENGYYFIKCLNKYDVELTEANKSNIVEKREKEAFDDIYNAFVAELSSGIDRDFWDALELNTSGEIQTDSFFEVFEKYCSEI